MVVVVIATILALAWMSYRVSALLNIPIPTLVKLLGLELPCPPRVSLRGISSDTITLHWSLPEKAGSVAKHIIQINGINVGESEKRGETSVTVTGLNPDQRYNVRVIAANSNNFQAPGSLIHLRTRRISQVVTESQATKLGDSSDDAPSIQSSIVETVSPAQTPGQQHQHQHQHQHQPHSRRSARERRGSPVTQELSHYHSHRGSAKEDRHTVGSLTRDLDMVRKEIQETEMQLAHIEEEYKVAEVVLKAELDTLKDKKTEEDSARQRLRAETKSLEEAKRAAEAMKTRTEKALRVKQYDVKKMRDDMARWEEECVVALEKVDELRRAAEESKENAATTEKEYGDDIKDAQANITEMEEKIRTLAGSLKVLEGHKEQLKAQATEESRIAKEDAEKERLWSEQLRSLEMRYLAVYNVRANAETNLLKSKEALLAFQRRGSGGSGDTSHQKKTKQRRNRNRKSRNVSSPVSSYPVLEPRLLDAAAFNGTQFRRSPTFNNTITSPFFNRANGTPLTGPPDIDIMTGPMLEHDRLTGGAPMSPTANSLLPSNLFGYDEDTSPSSKKSSSTMQEELHENSTPDFPSYTPQQPQSPLSSESVSTSPRSSFNHIPLFPSTSTEPVLDSDHGSISPIGSGRQASTTEETPSSGRKFVKLFSGSFTRQRGKTLPLDAGPIGSFKSAESHSFPKNDSPSLDPIGTRRRSGSYGSWATIPDFLHGNRSKKPLGRTNSDSSRRSAINQFHPSFDPFDPQRLLESASPVSPRPGSIASFDNLLPAPHEVDGAAFGWPAPAGLTRNSAGLPPLGSEWGLFRAGRVTQSHPTSRPISPVNNSSVSLSLLPSQIHPPPGFGHPSIGSTRPVTPRLNPTAPTFQSRQNPGSQPRLKEDAISIHSTTSTAVSGTPSMDSATATNSKDGILSRFSGLARKGSTGKFSGFFRKKGDEDSGSGVEEDPITKAGGLWSGWKRDNDADEGEDKVTPVTTPLAKESSPWIKAGKDGFFGTIGRKKGDSSVAKKDNNVQGDDGWDSDNSVIVGGGRDREKKREGLGIFRRRRAAGEGGTIDSMDER